MRSFVLGACLVFLAFVSLAVFTQEDESGHNPDSAHYATFENTEASPESDEDAVLDAAPTATELLRSASYSQNGDIAEAELNQGITADEAATLKNSASHASEYSETPLTAQVKTTRSEREKPCVGLCAIQAAHDSDMLREEIMTTHHAMDAFVQGSATPAAAASAAKPAAAGAKPPTGAKPAAGAAGAAGGNSTATGATTGECCPCAAAAGAGGGAKPAAAGAKPAAAGAKPAAAGAKPAVAGAKPKELDDDLFVDVGSDAAPAAGAKPAAAAGAKPAAGGAKPAAAKPAAGGATVGKCCPCGKAKAVTFVLRQAPPANEKKLKEFRLALKAELTGGLKLENGRVSFP